MGDDMNQNFTIKGINRVILVGKGEYKEQTTVFTSDLRANELIFHFSGKAIVHFNGKVLETEENTIRFLPKGENKEYIVERIEWGECIDICFDTDVPISTEAFTLKIKQSEKVKNLFKKVFSVWVAKEDGYYFESISLLYKIFAELQKQNYIPESQYLAIEPAIEYIKENFLSNNLTIESLASKCKISRSYFKKLFIKKFGVPPVKYIIQLKINYACDLLQSGLYNITQTAELCGYNNVYFFSRQFKEYMGITPSAFIEKYKSSK